MTDMSITLDLRGEVERIRHGAGHALSSHAFASLFLWRRQMGLSLLALDGAYSARCLREDALFFPCGSPDAARAFVEGLSPGDRLVYLRGRDAAYLEKAFAGRFRLRRRHDADEYLYAIRDHLALSGGAFAKLHTQVHRVEHAFDVRTEPLGPDNLSDALRVIRGWRHGERRFGGIGLRDDEVDAEALALLGPLGMEGVLTRLDGRPAAVTAGFPLTDDTFDIAVSKCVENLQGLSYYSKRELMRGVADRFAFINLEEDLGLEGLRRTKQGLQPVAFNRIWEAVCV